MTDSPVPSRSRLAFMVVALVLVALNLRLAITSTSALLTALTESGALTDVTVVIVPAVPTAVFAIAGLSTARLSARLGVERTIGLGMIVLTTGLLMRALPSPWIVVAGTVIATSGLAIVNILLPAVVRAHFGRHIGPITTVYSTAMSIGAAAAAAAAVPIATAFDSASIGLAVWAVPAIIAVGVWAFAMPLGASRRTTNAPLPDGESGRRPLPRGTWLLAGFFATQSLLSYILMGWLPSIAVSSGLSSERAGVLLAVMMAVGAPATVLVVPLTRTPVRMRIGFTLIAAATIAGVAGLTFAPTALPEVWAACLGLGMCAFPFALVLIAGLGRDAADSARASSVIQSVGYTLATVGPLGAGAIHQATGSWTPVLGILAGGALVQLTLGLLLTRIGGEPSRFVRAGR
ncbi:MFS transporter [Microbacterium sp. ZW T5_56]|uniref:MFS transporter n=1 Tax=Microbacterium sp. ZW T5_56 TaxID=3378081 RepID=UPI0038554798